MSLLDWVRRPAATGAVVEVDQDMLQIPSLGFYGPYSRSPDGKYLVAWSDYDSARGIGGHRNSGAGHHALVSDGRVLSHGVLERPNEGKVANDGSFVIADWLWGDGLKGVLYAFLKTGQRFFEARFNANIFNIGLSPNGRWAVAQLCNAPSPEGGCLCLFELPAGRLAWRLTPPSGWAEAYDFQEDRCLLGLSYRDRGTYYYSIEGKFLDEVRWQQDRITHASPVELVWIVDERLRGSEPLSLERDEAERLLLLLQNAVTKGLTEFPRESGRAHRLMGQIYESIGDTVSAVREYETALSVDSKVGIRRRLEKLKRARAAP
jgi:hypothetical protein